MQASTAAIILAAGSSSRMNAGRHKLLLPLGGRSVLAHVIETTLASQAKPIILILGYQANQIRAQIAKYITHPMLTLIENPNYLQGMSTSLQIGLQTLISNKNHTQRSSHSPDSALIILGDQPLVTTHIIDTLITTKHITGKHIIAPLYNGKRGHPMLFDVSLFTELMDVTGDEGGRSVIERHRQKMATVEMGDRVANYDVDTWETYQQVMQEWQRKQESGQELE